MSSFFQMNSNRLQEENEKIGAMGIFSMVKATEYLFNGLNKH